MANYVSKATGNWLTVGTWYNVEDQTRGVQATHSATTDTTTSIVYNADAQDFTGTNLKDCVGILVFCNQKTATGTVKVSLSADSGTTETTSLSINATDLPLSPSWVFFKFASALTLDGGTDYAIGIYGSSAGNATFYRDSTTANWTHLVVWSTSPAALAAADCFYIAGVQTGAGAETAATVTMNETANTDYGTVDIGNIGTLSFASGSAANPYLKLSGNLNTWGDGVLSIGTTGTPIPRDSTAVLEFDPTSDGEFGLIINNGATFNAQGLSRTSGKNVVSCLLNTDEAIDQTELGVDTDTGWLDNDEIAIASTTQTYSQCEKGTLKENADTNHLDVDGFGGAGGGLAYAHSGTSPTQAEVILLTRNVKIRSATSTLVTYCYLSTTSSSDIDWVEFYYLGEDAVFKRGISIDGTCNMSYCSFHDFEDYGLYIGSSSYTLSYNVFYKCNTGLSGASVIRNFATAGTWTMDNNIIIYGTTGTTMDGVELRDLGGTFTNNRIAGIYGYGVEMNEVGEVIGTFTDNIIHSCYREGFYSSTDFHDSTISNLTIWRCNGFNNIATSGMTLHNGCYNNVFNNITLFGNSYQNLSINGYNNTFINLVSNGDTTFSTDYGIKIIFSYLSSAKFITCNLGTASGIKTAHTADIAYSSTNGTTTMILLINTILASSTEFDTTNVSTVSANNFYVSSERTDTTAGNHKTWKKYGTITVDTTANMYRTASPSERLTPNNASAKLESGSKKIAVANGATLTPSVYVRESVAGDGTDYNGNRVRLILKRNDAIGITADTVLKTATVNSEGAFEQLTETTAAATDDGVMEFVVDCDGTTGWVNVDDWSVT